MTPTKESIVQRLLDEKHITAEEAVVLLKEVIYSASTSNHLLPPFKITCGASIQKPINTTGGIY